jgi:hypothetical protein
MKSPPLISLHMVRTGARARRVRVRASCHNVAHTQAGTGYPVGAELLPLLASLGSNKTLADLDLRDNGVGNRGAVLLSQVRR